MAKTNELVKFYRGSETIYQNTWKTEEGKATLAGALFFDSETKHIWYNGVQYGINVSNDLGDYATKNWVNTEYAKAFIDITSDNGLDGYAVTFMTKDGEPSDFGFTIPLAAADRNGLMTSGDWNRIGTMESDINTLESNLNTTNTNVSNIQTKLDTIEEYAEVNAINTIKVDDAALEIKEEGNVRYVNIDLTNTIKEIVGIKVGTAYVYMGSYDTIEDLNSVTKVNGNVYNITNQFTLDGKVYPAGTNVAWNESESKWDALGGTVNLEPIETAIDTINNTLETHTNKIEALEKAVGGGNGEGESLSGRVTTLEGKVNILNDTVEVEGSVKNTATTIVEDALTWMELS